MNLWFRLIWIAITGRARPVCGLSDVCSTPFMVVPTDLDLFGHMSNSRYLSMMDLARIDWLLRSAKWQKLRRGKLVPLVTRTSVRYRKSLSVGMRFQVESSLVAWNEKDFFVLQRFVAGDQVYSEGLIQGRFIRRGKGSVSSAETFAVADASEMRFRVNIVGDVNFGSVWAAAIGEK